MLKKTLQIDEDLKYHADPTCICLKRSPKGTPPVYWETQTAGKCQHCSPLGGGTYHLNDIEDP